MLRLQGLSLLMWSGSVCRSPTKSKVILTWRKIGPLSFYHLSNTWKPYWIKLPPSPTPKRTATTLQRSRKLSDVSFCAGATPTNSPVVDEATMLRFNSKGRRPAPRQHHRHHTNNDGRGSQAGGHAATGAMEDNINGGWRQRQASWPTLEGDVPLPTQINISKKALFF